MKINPFYLISLTLLVILGFAIYAVNLNNELFWDDTDWIVNNPYVHEFSWENVKNWFSENTLAGIGLRSNYYRPFLFTTFTINYELHGIWPAGYHLVNNFLHIANSILIFFLLLVGVRRRAVALVVALIFLVHPLQTEAVTYVAGRGDPLNVFFMLAALLAFVLMEQGRIRPGMGYSISLGALALAFLSRETAIIFPFLVMLYYVAFLRKDSFLPALKRGILKTLPYFGIVAVYGVLRLTVLNFDNTLNFYSQPNAYSENLVIRMYTFMGILVTYAKLLIVPLGLHMERSATIFGTPWHAAVLIPFAILVMLGFWLRYLYRRQAMTFGASDFSLWLFAIGWFFINLGPTSGITPINALVYEHWLYLALVGPALLVAWYGVAAWERWHTPLVRKGLPLVLVGVLGWFSILTIRRNIVWGDPIRFFQDIVEKYEPGSSRINNNLGNLFHDKGDIDKAAEYYRRSIDAGDTFPQPYFNLGTIMYARGDRAAAKELFEKAIQIDKFFPYAYQGLAAFFVEEGDYAKAVEMLERFAELNPRNPVAYLNLAKMALLQNNLEKASVLLDQAGLLAGDNPDIQKEIARVRAIINASGKRS